jgi:putative FmdB family regulatory protein
MPIYEYACSVCGHAFEHLARTLADQPAACPACGAKKLAKQLSTFAPAAAVPKKACGHCAGAPSCPASRTGGCAGACGLG